MSIITIITWWLEVGTLAFAGGIAIGLGVSWLFCPQDPAAQADPSALSEWPPILGALRAAGKRVEVRETANEAFDVLGSEQSEGREPRL
jgi:hypothetical protein